MIILRSLLALILGVVVGGVVNMSLVMLGSTLIPAPAGVDPSDAASIAASIHLFEPKHFLFPFLAHALGTLAGALLAYLVAPRGRVWFALGIGALSLAGGVAASLMIPAPAWFMALDLLGAYLPMAGLAILIGQRIRSNHD